MPKPAAHWHAKSLLPSSKYLARYVSPHRVFQRPFTSPEAHELIEPEQQSLLDQVSIQKGQTQLDAVIHAHCVRVTKQNRRHVSGTLEHGKRVRKVATHAYLSTEVRRLCI